MIGWLLLFNWFISLLVWSTDKKYFDWVQMSHKQYPCIIDISLFIIAIYFSIILYPIYKLVKYYGKD